MIFDILNVVLTVINLLGTFILFMAYRDVQAMIAKKHEEHVTLDTQYASMKRDYDAMHAIVLSHFQSHLEEGEAYDHKNTQKEAPSLDLEKSG